MFKGRKQKWDEALAECEKKQPYLEVYWSDETAMWKWTLWKPDIYVMYDTPRVSYYSAGSGDFRWAKRIADHYGGLNVPMPEEQ